MTAAEILSMAAFDEGRRAQAFPSFGSERTGAPVVSYCRIDDKEIRTREPVMVPDAVIVQDVTLINQVDLFSGLSPVGFILINTSRSFEELGLDDLYSRFVPSHLATCPATEIALEHFQRPLPNAALLGAFASLTGEITLSAVQKAIRDHFVGVVGERNATAAAAAFDVIEKTTKGSNHAATN